MITVTYSPEDNKLRLYIGRVPRDEYDRLRAAGFTPLHKQREAGHGDFAATWTPGREDLAAEYLEDGEDIGDGDYSPTERAADRADRFDGYREKRADEATGTADTFESGPQVFGHQNEKRAERQAARHDRLRVRSVSQWSKAEYWQMRTAGVIANALHRSSAPVRRGRILTLEAEERKQSKMWADYAARFRMWSLVLTKEGADATKPAEDAKPTPAWSLAYTLANSGSWGDYKHPRTGRDASMYSHLTDHADPITAREAATLWLAGKTGEMNGDAKRWHDHYALRLTYERAMLENEGGSAGNVEMEPGGRIGEYLIVKVNKSAETGAVVSVNVHAPKREGEGWDYRRRGDTMLLNVQRFGEAVYTPPTDESRAEVAKIKGAKTERTQARNAAGPKLINPTLEAAKELQAAINAIGKGKHEAQKNAKYCKPFEPTPVLAMTQAQYSATSKGTYSSFETRMVHRAGGIISRRSSNMYSSEGREYDDKLGPAVCKLRVRSSGGGWFSPPHVIVITDKPQKPLPDWTPAPATAEAPALVNA